MYRSFSPFVVRLKAAITLPPRFSLLTTVVTGSILALRFGLDTADRFGNDIAGMSAYITAMGVLYSILAAFTIYVVWTRFNDAQDATASEANDLLDLFRFAVYLRDQGALEGLRASITEYCQAVCEDEWAAMTSGHPSHSASAKFERVFEAVNSVQFDDERDAHAWSEMIRKFEAISDARSKRLELATAKVPALLRGLLYMASLALVVGFFMLAIDNDFLAVAVTVATTAVVFLTIEVVEDLDDPFGGQWALTPEPFVQLPDRLASISEPAA